MSSIQTLLFLALVLAAYGVAGRLDEDAARQAREAARPPARLAVTPSHAQDRATAVRAPAADAVPRPCPDGLGPEVAP